MLSSHTNSFLQEEPAMLCARLQQIVADLQDVINMNVQLVDEREADEKDDLPDPKGGRCVGFTQCCRVFLHGRGMPSEMRCSKHI